MRCSPHHARGSQTGPWSQQQRSGRGAGAPGRTRTSTGRSPADFESAASTSSATGARTRHASSRRRRQRPGDTERVGAGSWGVDSPTGTGNHAKLRGVKLPQGASLVFPRFANRPCLAPNVTGPNRKVQPALFGQFIRGRLTKDLRMQRRSSLQHPAGPGLAPGSRPYLQECLVAWWQPDLSGADDHSPAGGVKAEVGRQPVLQQPHQPAAGGLTSIGPAAG